VRGHRRWQLPLTFAALGGTGALFGPALPAIAQRLDVEVARASLSVSALFVGLLASVAILQLPAVRADWQLNPLRRWAAIVQAGALLAVPLSASLWALLASSAIVGLGFGVSEATASAVAVAERDGASRISSLGAVFAVAAISTPAAVGLAYWGTGVVWPAFAVVSLLHLATTINGAPASEPSFRPAASIQRRRTSPRLGALLVLYVGAEVLLSTWAAEIARILLDLETSVAALAATGFWSCLAVGRWLAARWTRRIDAARLLRYVLAAAAAALLVAVVLGPTVATAAMIAFGVAIVMLGPAYALALSVGSVGTGTPSVPTAARRISLGAIGGALVPALAAPLATSPGAVLRMAAALIAAAVLIASPSRIDPMCPRAGPSSGNP
jgi:predicted MFS family arabinose efflux permease